eukprot:1190007-Prorocentrum_minimum.AAC.2
MLAGQRRGGAQPEPEGDQAEGGGPWGPSDHKADRKAAAEGQRAAGADGAGGKDKKVRTNHARGGRIFPQCEPITRGEVGYSRSANQSREGRSDIPEAILLLLYHVLRDLEVGARDHCQGTLPGNTAREHCHTPALAQRPGHARRSASARMAKCASGFADEALSCRARIGHAGNKRWRSRVR